MIKFFTKTLRKDYERKITLLKQQIKNRDNIIDDIVSERNLLREERKDLLETGLELQQQVIKLQTELNNINSKKTRKRNNVNKKEN